MHGTDIAMIPTFVVHSEVSFSSSRNLSVTRSGVSSNATRAHWSRLYCRVGLYTITDGSRRSLNTLVRSVLSVGTDGGLVSG